MLKPGMILCDRYEILEVVGAGGMSIVYKAKCHRLNRNVAIKVLKPEFSNDKNFVTKFRIEAQASAGLTHPNIVNVYDVYDDDGIYFIVMELVEGITLKEYINENGRLPMDKAIDFSIQISSALEAAHESHIIHRDIKPQNIMVNKNGNVKVTDFGIAKAASSNTLTSGAMGSVHYISPEQARGGYSDERSDIYSLGISMYEMVTGRVPFEGDNNVSVALMHIQNEMISPRQYYPDIYASFEKIILKATQKKPERRYLTASALIADLKRVQNNPNIDIVVAPSAITNSPTVEWSKEDVAAVRNASSVNAFANNAPFQNEMGEMQPVNSPSQIQVNNAKLNQLLEPEDDYWEDEEEDYQPQPVKKSIKKVQDYDEDEDYDDYDDESGEIDPNLKKAVIIGAIATAVIIALIAMIVLGKIFGWFKFGNGNKTTTGITVESTDTTEEVKEAEVADVVGVTEDAAKKLLSDFTNVKTVVENNQDYQAGYVFEQSVEPNKKVPVDTEIILKVSAGAEKVTVPDVTNYDDDRAVTILQEAGFEVTHAYEYDENIEKDKVIKTEPAANSEAAKGSKVVLTISNGTEVKNTLVPNLNGLTEAEAQNALASAKLKTGNVTHEKSDTVAAGYVIRQEVAMNTEVAEGTPINFVISDGAEEKPKKFTANISTVISTGNADYVNQDAIVQFVNANGNVVGQQTIRIAAAGESYSANLTVNDLDDKEAFSISIIVNGQNVTGEFGNPAANTSYSEQ